MAFKFADLLKSDGIEPWTVHLVRHQDAKAAKKTLYWLWKTNREDFERYQRTQIRDVFRIGNLVASFVAPSRTDTLFVGLYRVESVGRAPDDMVNPLSENSVAGEYLYDLALDPRLQDYAGKLSIDWGAGYRRWLQRADSGAKRVTERRRDLSEPEFPGYMRFIRRLSEVETLPQGWIARLREAKGVYVLTCPGTNELYVGSATGEGGFHERWRQHAGMQGDAIQFRRREPADYQVAVLEVAGSNVSRRDILHAEELWMKKLRTKEVGLNGGRLFDGAPDLVGSSTGF